MLLTSNCHYTTVENIPVSFYLAVGLSLSSDVFLPGDTFAARRLMSHFPWWCFLLVVGFLFFGGRATPAAAAAAAASRTSSRLEAPLPVDYGKNADFNYDYSSNGISSSVVFFQLVSVCSLVDLLYHSPPLSSFSGIANVSGVDPSHNGTGHHIFIHQSTATICAWGFPTLLRCRCDRENFCRTLRHATAFPRRKHVEQVSVRPVFCDNWRQGNVAIQIRIVDCGNASHASELRWISSLHFTNTTQHGIASLQPLVLGSESLLLHFRRSTRLLEGLQPFFPGRKGEISRQTTATESNFDRLNLYLVKPCAELRIQTEREKNRSSLFNSMSFPRKIENLSRAVSSPFFLL